MKKQINLGKLIILIFLCLTGLILIPIITAACYICETDNFDATVLGNLLKIYE